MLDTVPAATTSGYILNASRDYALYVCATRAIPHVADGLKHGQRIALWLLRNRAEKIKTFALTGLMGFACLYVHGEASANDAIGLLAAPYCNNTPLIEGLSQFGSRIAPVKGIGAPRYTDVRRAKAAEAILYADLDLVPLQPNYDGSNQEPVHFLPLLPTVLLNGISGIAVGWSTEILPRPWRHLVAATKAVLDGQPITTLDPGYTRYDLDIQPRGPNQWDLIGKAKLVAPGLVQISELPPGLSVENFRKRLIAMQAAGTINSFVDRSADSIDIAVKLPRQAPNQWSADQLITLFKLRERVTERLVVLDWDHQSIRVYASAAELVADFVHWRLGWYRIRFESRLRTCRHDLAYWRALHHLFAVHFPGELGGFADRAALERRLGELLPRLADDHADRITGLPTYRWTAAFAAEVDRHIAELAQAEIEYVSILASPDQLRQAYRHDLDAIAVA